MSYLRRLKRADVLRVVRREYPRKEWSTVRALLDEYGTESWHRERDRVQLAVLKLSRGDIKRLRRYLRKAKFDYRDVILPAEYPRFSKVGFVGTSQMGRKEKSQLIEDDRAQYESWLYAKEAQH